MPFARLLSAVILATFIGNACGTDPETGGISARTVATPKGPPPGCIQGDYHAYFGMFHAHTSFSDGEGTPAEAFAYARDQAGLDVFALTDHLEQIYLPCPPDKWKITVDAANGFNDPGTYVAMAGFEYGTAYDLCTMKSSGHNNVFFSEDLFPMLMLDFHRFYRRLAECPDCIAQFNHPWEDSQTNWNDFSYDPEVDGKMNLMEMPSGMEKGWPILFQALDNGWHMSPAANQDNHDADWGTRDNRRTGLWMADLTRDEVRICMRDRRTFATDDKNATILLQTEEHACWMGSVLSAATPIALRFEASDPDGGEGFDRVELWGYGQTLIETIPCGGDNPCAHVVDVSLAGSGYVLAKASQMDGDILISAPVWLNAP